jgi:hypothetical protein
MVSVQFDTLKGQPQRVFPVHDLGNGISYDQALRATNAMQNRLHMMERTGGNLPFPDKIPKFIAAKVERYLGEMQSDYVANAELEARLNDSLHNEVEEEQRRQEAMTKARKRIELFHSISELGLDSMSEDSNEVNPYTPEGVAHLEWKSRQMHGAGLETMMSMQRSGGIASQFAADKRMRKVQKKAGAAARRRVEGVDPFGEFGSPSSAATSTPRSAIRGLLGTSALSPMETLEDIFAEKHEAEEVVRRSREKKPRTKQRKPKPSDSGAGAGAGASRPVATSTTTRIGRRTKEPLTFEEFVGGSS